MGASFDFKNKQQKARKPRETKWRTSQNLQGSLSARLRFYRAIRKGLKRATKKKWLAF